jgi:hypothetical protein
LKGQNPARGTGYRPQQPEQAGQLYLLAAHRAGAGQLPAGEDHARDASKQFGGRSRLRLARLEAGGKKGIMDIEVRIRGLMMDPATNMPIVVLKDVASETVMPIWVGIFEANAIAIEIEKVAAPRPMTHDLTRNLIRHLNAQLERVVITELKDDTFLAVLWLRQGMNR